MSVEERIREYLPVIRTGQLATAVNNQPRVCTVHYYSDENLNIYWISTLERHHSQDIAQNSKAALAIKVHEDKPADPTENYIIGISIIGTAELIGEHIDIQIGKNYVEKLSKDPNLLADIASGKNPHRFYRLKPAKFALFDNKNFPEEPYQEWEPNA